MGHDWMIPRLSHSLMKHSVPLWNRKMLAGERRIKFVDRTQEGEPNSSIGRRQGDQIRRSERRDQIRRETKLVEWRDQIRRQHFQGLPIPVLESCFWKFWNPGFEIMSWQFWNPAIQFWNPAIQFWNLLPVLESWFWNHVIPVLESCFPVLESCEAVLESWFWNQPSPVLESA